jgi:hypothetical protein
LLAFRPIKALATCRCHPDVAGSGYVIAGATWYWPPVKTH